MKAFRLALIPLVIASTFSSTAHAVDDNRFYIAPMGSYAIADDDRHSKDGIGGTLAFGALLTNSIAFELRGTYLQYKDPQAQTEHQGILGAADTFTAKKKNDGGGAGFNLYFTDNLGPYVHADLQYGSKQMFNAGLGYDLPLTESGIGIRVEALYHAYKAGDGLGEQGRDYYEPLFNLGVRIPFGPKPVEPPPPPPPVVVPPTPAPPPPQCSDGIDNDGDGKIDYPADPGCTDANDNDETDPPPVCKAPLPGQKMSLVGCGVNDTIVLQGVTFEFDKANLTANAKTVLDGVADALTERPDIKVELGGHTDSKGKPAYNLKLSDRRAASVKKYLESKGIAADRMTSHGYGETVPIADNKTDEGRELNRRVELKVTDASATASPVEVAPLVRTAEDSKPLPADAPIAVEARAEDAPAAPAPSAAPAAAAAGGSTVTIQNFAFSPATITVPVGTTVTWTNADGSNHFVAFPDDKSPRLKQGATFQKTFSAPGTYAYACTLHPEMKGTVVVQ